MNFSVFAIPRKAPVGVKAKKILMVAEKLLPLPRELRCRSLGATGCSG